MSQKRPRKNSNPDLFGLIKTERKRHREKAALTQQIWEAIPLS